MTCSCIGCDAEGVSRSDSRRDWYHYCWATCPLQENGYTKHALPEVSDEDFEAYRVNLIFSLLRGA